MQYIPQIAFVLVLFAAGYFLSKRIRQIRRNIMMGQPVNRADKSPDRWKAMLLIAFGQKKMFKNMVPALLHLLIYVGFLVINLEVLEFILDGLFGTHRLFAPFLGDFYTVCINFFELLAVGVLFSCVVFLIRRNVIKVDRFSGHEMTSWPKLDANLILVIEIILMLAILTMNATDQILQVRGNEQYTVTGTFFFSGLLVPLFEGLSDSALVLTERFAWWFHIVGIFAFAVYVTYSKHLHIFMAFPNTWYGNLEAPGKIENMPVVTNEVKTMLGMPAEEGSATPANPDEIGRFGAKDVADLNWVNLMNAYACTECGRCTSNCPASLTGKKLSPRKIMMDTRDRLEEVGNGKGPDDGKSLLGDYITKEEINACTSCNACVEACPVNIDPLSIILQLRRYVAMEESGSPASWNAMFSNIETSFSPWKFAPTDRFNWSEELKQTPKPD